MRRWLSCAVLCLVVSRLVPLMRRSLSPADSDGASRVARAGARPGRRFEQRGNRRRAGHRHRRTRPGAPASAVTNQQGEFELAVLPGALHRSRQRRTASSRRSRRVTLTAGRDRRRRISPSRSPASRNRSASAPTVGYSVPAVSSATKTTTPLRDVPQAVSVVSSALIADQRMASMADVDALHAGRRHRAGRRQPRHADPPRQQHDLGLLRRRRSRRRPVLPRRLQRRSRRGAQGPERHDLRPRRRRRRDQPRDAAGRLGAGARSVAAVRLVGQQALHRRRRPRPERRRWRVRATGALRELRLLPRRRRPRALRLQSDRGRSASARNTTLRASYEYFHDERTADRGISSFNGRPVETDPARSSATRRRAPPMPPSTWSRAARAPRSARASRCATARATATTTSSTRTSSPAPSTPPARRSRSPPTTTPRRARTSSTRPT